MQRKQNIFALYLQFSAKKMLEMYMQPENFSKQRNNELLTYREEGFNEYLILNEAVKLIITIKKK